MCRRGMPWPPDRRAAVDTALQLHLVGVATANGAMRVLQLPPSHNRVEVLVEPGGGAAAGDILVSRVERAEGETVSALAATVAFAATGGRAVLEVAPGAQLAFAATAIAGGDLAVIAASWAEW